MKKLLTVISVVCLGVFGVTGTVLAGGPTVTVATPDLIAGGGDGGDIIGDVLVEADCGTGQLNVNVNADSPWLIIEAHLDIQNDDADCSNVPQTGSGNPKVGKFGYEYEVDFPSVDGLATAPFLGVGSGIFDGASDVCVAAHAVVYDSSLVSEPPSTQPQLDCDAETGSDGVVTRADAFDCSGESAWAAGDDFGGKNWATYFTFDLTCP